LLIFIEFMSKWLTYCQIRANIGFDWLHCEINQTHLIPPILTYVRLHAMRFKVDYPPSLKLAVRLHSVACILTPLTSRRLRDFEICLASTPRVG